MVNFFEIFGIKQEFAIDKDVLEKLYLEFQTKFHPDKADIAQIDKSIQINEGYRILGDDFLRACHLLALNGIDILNNENAIKVDQEILLEVLDLQESIDSEQDLVVINDLMQDLANKSQNLVSKAVLILGSDVAAAAQLLVKAKYFKKSIADLKDKKKKLRNAI